MRSLVRCFVLSALLSLSAQATIILIADYRLGDNDPGAVAGNPVNSTTLDSSGNGNTMNLVGSGTYVNTPTGLGVNLNGTAAGYSTGVFSTLTDNFGVEVRVFSNNSPANSQVIFYNGSTSFNGWGLYEAAGTWGILYGGVGYYSVAVTANQWVTLAMVRASGTTTLYLNGVAQLTTTDLPKTPAGILALGDKNAGIPGNGFFSGMVDQARVFSFAAGTFAAGTDLLEPVPEPSTWALMGLGLAAVGYARRRRVR